ncbi:MAG: pyruvate dehydrogenase component, partial [Acidimicrobiaceae bacterium]|nr:pyruvate dehydrogenase component [Acidimicrobiaceae bacterium]
DVDLSALEAVQQRVLWLAVRMVDAANHDRADAGGIKVGGHQASSASMVSMMTALWFGHLGPDDKVAVKPHASPVFHAVQYLLGVLDRSYLPRLRDYGGLQAYPSRTKDPDKVDYSTGSVGLGAVAPLFGAAVRRYVDAHFGPRPHSRFISLLGDAELDEGNVWEAINDPATQGLGNVLWIVDLNRQSLDRVIPGIKAARLERMFDDNGWHVVEAKYGRLLQAAFSRDGGEALRRRIDEMPNQEYQSLFAYRGAELRDRFLTGADPDVKRALADVADDDLAPLVQNLGGHDLPELLSAYAAADAVEDRPSVVFAYTVKGWGLPIAGDPLNHSALLTPAQIDAFRSSLGLDATTEWDRFTEDSPGGRLCAEVAERLLPANPASAARLAVPPSVGAGAARTTSTQEAFGRILVGLARHEDVAARMVTTSPDVSVSTNLGGWINKMGVFSPADVPDWLGSERLLRWRETPAGHHIELGISEMNLFLLLSQLGLAHDLSGERLLPVGTLYDPFVCRGLDALIYAVYSGARFVVAGTPSGVTLSPEGGAHQSAITASIGLELPGLTLAEPAYAAALDWLLCDGLDRLSDPEASSLYVRLSTRPLDQAPFEAARRRYGDDELRAAVLAGGYRLLPTEEGRPADVHLVASGAVVPEALAAARELADEGVSATVIDVTSLDRLYQGWRSALRRDVRSASLTASADAPFHLASLLPPDERRAPIVTIHDAASHAMAWIGSVFGAPVVPLGVDEFGQSGSIEDLYRHFDLLPGAIVNAALMVAG